MRSAVVLLALVAGAGCAASSPLTVVADFRMVEESATTYAMRVLDASAGNVTLEVQAPAFRGAVRDLPNEGMVASVDGRTVFLRLYTEEDGTPGPNARPTWTLRLENARPGGRYDVVAEVERMACGDPCQGLAKARVENVVRVERG